VGVSPTLQKTRLWGRDLSGTPQGAGGVGGMLSESSPINSNPITFNSSYPTYDGNGNVSEYLNSTGQVTAHFEYDPFGNTVVNTDTSNQFAYRFSTKPLAFATGLYYYGYRYYDPMTGRWPSRDLLEENGGYCLYGFVFNDPNKSVDILGLLTFNFHGNWGGPGRVNGQTGKWTEDDDFPREGDDDFVEPSDEQDQCYYEHDTCIADCPKCPKKTYKKCVRNCDKKLSKCLSKMKNKTPKSRATSLAFKTVIPHVFHRIF
jgi:RHS repeat-associated protein